MNGSERIVRQPARLRTRAARRGHDARAECRRVREPSPFAPAGERRLRRPAAAQDSTSSRLKISVWSLYEKISP